MKTLSKIALKMGKVKAIHCLELIRQDLKNTKKLLDFLEDLRL